MTAAAETQPQRRARGDVCTGKVRTCDTTVRGKGSSVSRRPERPKETSKSRWPTKRSRHRHRGIYTFGPYRRGTIDLTGGLRAVRSPLRRVEAACRRHYRYSRLIVRVERVISQQNPPRPKGRGGNVTPVLHFHRRDLTRFRPVENASHPWVT